MKPKTRRDILLARARKKIKNNLPRAHFRAGDFVRHTWNCYIDDYIVIRVVRKYSDGEVYDLLHVTSQRSYAQETIFIKDRYRWTLCSRPGVDVPQKSAMFEVKGT